MPAPPPATPHLFSMAHRRQEHVRSEAAQMALGFNHTYKISSGRDWLPAITAIIAPAGHLGDASWLLPERISTCTPRGPDARGDRMPFCSATHHDNENGWWLERMEGCQGLHTTREHHVRNPASALTSGKPHLGSAGKTVRSHVD